MQVLIDRWNGSRAKITNVVYFTVSRNKDRLRVVVNKDSNKIESYNFNSNDIISIHTNMYD